MPLPRTVRTYPIERTPHCTNRIGMDRMPRQSRAKMVGTLPEQVPTSHRTTAGRQKKTCGISAKNRHEKGRQSSERVAVRGRMGARHRSRSSMNQQQHRRRGKGGKRVMATSSERSVSCFQNVRHLSLRLKQESSTVGGGASTRG
jgi:hypothetical protein